MSKNYELVKRIAVIGGKEGSVTKEVNLVKWGVFDPMIDIRRWQNGEPSKGISLKYEEAEKLCWEQNSKITGMDKWHDR